MMRRLVRDCAGAAVAEFALVAPVLVFLLLGVIDVGRYVYYGIVASHAARAGLQYGAQNSMTALDSAGITNAALQDGQNLSNWHVSESVVCTVNGSATSCPANNTQSVPTSLVYFVQVNVTGSFNTLVSYPGFPTKIPVSGSAIMRLGSQ